MSRLSPRYIRFSIVAIVILLALGYAVYNSRILIKGPEIIIETPQNAATVDEKLISIKGKATNISFISLNDKQIFVDEEGNFEELLLLSEGYNIIIIEGVDKFERETRKELELVFNQNL